jgi:hypothetical protein
MNSQRHSPSAQAIFKKRKGITLFAQGQEPDGDKEFKAGLMARDSLCVNDNDIGEDQTV